MTTIEPHSYPLHNGTLTTLEAGPPNGERILLLHGIPASAELFRAVMVQLAEQGYRAIAPNMPGYGSTRLADAADYSLSAVADLYKTWLESANLAPVWVVGHDLGGAVSQLMAVRYPQLFTRYTVGNAPLGDSFPVFSVKLARLIAKAGLLPTVQRFGSDPYTTRQVYLGFADRAKLTPEMLERIFWDSKISDPQGRREFAKHLQHLRSTENVEIVDQLKNIPVPTLVLWSAGDRFQTLEKVGKPLQQALPAATPLAVIEGGHFSPAEAPQAYAEALLQWGQSIT